MQKLNKQQLPTEVLNDIDKKLESVKVNGTAQTVSSHGVDIQVPTKVSQLTNDAHYDTEESVADKIAVVSEQMSSSNSTQNTGDICIMPYNNEAPTYYQRRSTGMIGTIDYADNIPGGYVFTGPATAYRNKVFNRIKMIVKTPGWVRIGIVRGTGKDKGIDKASDGIARGVFKQNPRYDNTDIYPTSLVNNEEDTTADGNPHTSLVKWLVVTWVATTGAKEWDFEDTIITSPFEYLYAECRCGVAGFTMNRTGGDMTVNGNTIPTGTVNNGVNWSASFLTETEPLSGFFPISNNMLDASCRYAYESYKSSKGGGYPRGWTDLNYNSNDQNPSSSVHGGDLNIGVYKRGTGGNKYLCPLVENCKTNYVTTTTSLNGNNALRGYGPRWETQQKLVGKKIYAIQVIVSTPGDLSFFVFSSKDPATCKILKHYTLRVRAIGPQTIHLPEDVILKEGNWCGICGVTQALSRALPNEEKAYTTGKTFKPGYVDTCIPIFNIPEVNNWTCKGDDPTGVQNLVPLSSATGERNTGFNHWSNVKYIPGENDGEGRFDFTTATLSSNLNTYLNLTLVVRGDPISKLEDLWCSITGDSISTYKGVISNTNDFGVTTNGAGDNAVFYPNSGSGSTLGVDSTWWGTLIKQTRMRFLRNDAWSGSRVSGTDSNTASSACASSIRASMLKSSIAEYTPVTEEGALTHPFGTPDIIFCMIGTNDLSGNVELGSYSNTAPTNISTIIGAFETMVYRHRVNYPQAHLVYFMIPRGTSIYPYKNGSGVSISDMAEAMEKTAKNLGAHFVPLSYFGALNQRVSTGQSSLFTITSGYDLPSVSGVGDTAQDYLHPNATGHQIIANALQTYCEANLVL